MTCTRIAKLLACAALVTALHAGEIHVMISGAFSGAYKAVAQAYEKQTGDTLVTAYGPSMGDTPEAIPNRLQRGEPADVLIMARSALDMLVKQGKVASPSEVDLVRSPIGLAVKAGEPQPDISSVDGLKRTLLRARSIAYSDSASGMYVSGELFRKLGIETQVAPKSRMIPATPVGQIVAAGEVDVGFQQLSELLSVSGIQVVGPIPDAVQKITIFSAGITTTTQSPAAARRLIEYLASPAVWAAIRSNGLEPASGVKRSSDGAGNR